MQDALLTATPLAALFVSVFVAAASIGTALVVRSIVARSLPQRAMQAVESLEERCHQLELDWNRVRGDLAVSVENLEQLEESIERKRKRAAASASKAEAARSDQTPEPAGPDELLSQLRQRIYGAGGAVGGGLGQ